MKKVEAIYYLFMAIIIALSGFGLDFFNIQKQLPVIFITEFAAILIMAGHIFHINRNKDVPAFLRKKSKLGLIGTFLFFYIWAGIILIRNNYLFALASFIVSSTTKALRIDSLSQNKTELEKNTKISTLQFCAIFLSLLIGILLNSLKLNTDFLKPFWGVLYFGILSAMIFFYVDHTNKIRG